MWVPRGRLLRNTLRCPLKPADGVGSRQDDPRRRRGQLSRERVLAAALALVDAEGVDTLTMRRLGRELGCNAMALYRYANSRDALLDGVWRPSMAELANYDGAAELDQGLDILLTGLRGQLLPPAPPR